ncbi:ssDNA-specific exonuclease RecJ [Brachyspira hampsonii 30446]|uniref:Single-stranded-DNA-specific exonuclease RecJ n=1 Tax=Brachyspira hampsonii 30446 TaxID=1289135 RepID=A0A2U4EXH9_9SPIR|nr:single-stranded-DNA-specific exonuclease RecJ [Brachyspira hampsonii]EKV57946.1 ssDNA-specific exonuclease RecJ [Brachyspira hampsonii 30446]MBW5395443.1 single-stranded-DNA-specific exonuclease RecJ [Brachyspira hampsonii]
MDINNLNTAILELLKLRGITSKEDIYDFFFQDIYSLSNPFNIMDVNVFVDRVKEAIENDEKILVYGDKDADGITAASIIYNTLKMVTKNVEAFVPNHTTGYGLSKSVIEEYANSGISLIITVDCGISNAEEVEFARDLSIDIIVTDHHDIPEILPNAYAVFNPKISNTGFVSKNFSGCAVAFKLMQAFVFSYTKLYNKDIIVLDYEIDRSKNVLKRIRALKSTNFVISDEVFGFELINNDNRYKSMYADYYDELMSEDEVLEELASYMFEGDGCVLVLTGGEERLKRLIHFYEKYEIYLPEYDNVYDLLQLGAKYGNVNIKTTKTLNDFALALNVNIYRYDNIEYRDLIIKMEIFRRLFYISQKQLQNYIKKKSILVLFGSVADVVPLIEENRAYVKCALKELEKPSHIRYNIILERINLLNTKIDTQIISWRLAPFINAAGRMGSPETALKLLTCEIKEEAMTLSNEVYNMNETRKSLTESNFNIVNEYIKANSCLDLPIIVVKSKKIEQGLTGLIAGKVLSEYGKTAVIMHENDDGICIGSIRSRGEDNARDMLEYANIYLTKFGGHKNAAGFTLNTDNFEKFQSKIIKYASNQNFQTEKNDDVFDMELSFKEIDIKFARLLELFEPYGCGNEEPLFMSKKVKVNGINKMKKNNKTHLRLELLQDNKKVNAIMWDKSDEEADKLLSSDYIDIIYKLKVNRFNGSEDARIYVESYKIF